MIRHYSKPVKEVPIAFLKPLYIQAFPAKQKVKVTCNLLERSEAQNLDYISAVDAHSVLKLCTSYHWIICITWII
jgi:hypothetical protein